MSNKIRVGIIDYNVGNVSSVKNAISKLGFTSIISNNSNRLEKCSHLILPGVGAFDAAFSQLQNSGLIPFLETQLFVSKKPILGICVGMQLMMESGTENGMHKGLGWVRGVVDKIESDRKIRLPHVGWNKISFQNSCLYKNIDSSPYYYFDHSYYCMPIDNVITSQVTYQTELVSSFEKDNLFGVQFHPEKSQINGLRLFKNFLTTDHA